MCKIFIGVPNVFYRPKNRSVRLNGLSTSLALENYFWSVLEQIGNRDGLTLGRLCSKLYDEFIETHGLSNRNNFSSFLRVCCLRYLALQVSGGIPTDKNISIASLDADFVLASEFVVM
jgi:predicted DNA-binding ribbon-helix-helix protein